ncbi:MAG: hypothetical protein EAZ42_04665 [Verrucomicrobia bacterium]|nr:MAG: hypothetical protein EAZ42_04665 [Verrucomicrobiota bacterium]
MQITFFGGEPLLNYEMIKRIVAYCKEIERLGTKVFTFELITNGTLLDKEVVEFCVEHKFLLFISIDGWKEMHDYNRPAMGRDDACYETIIENATYANRRYIEMGLHPIKARANLTKQFPDMWKVGAYLASLGFKTVGVGAIEPLPHGFASPSAMTDDQLDALHEETTEVFIDALERTRSNLPLDPFVAKKFSQVMSKMAKRELKGITCGIGRNTQIVDNKGNIFPCHRYEGMENFIIGDVFSGLDRGKTMGYYFAVNSHAVEKCSKC